MSSVADTEMLEQQAAFGSGRVSVNPIFGAVDAESDAAAAAVTAAATVVDDDVLGGGIVTRSRAVSQSRYWQVWMVRVSNLLARTTTCRP